MKKYGIAAAVILILLILIFKQGRINSGASGGTAENVKEKAGKAVTGDTGETMESSTAESTQAFEDFVIDWKDTALEARMRTITGIESGPIMYSDIYEITELDLSCSAEEGEDKKIHDISALEKLTALKKLDLSGNQISDVSALCNLTGLLFLYISDNNIEDYSPIYDLDLEMTDL